MNNEASRVIFAAITLFAIINVAYISRRAQEKMALWNRISSPLNGTLNNSLVDGGSNLKIPGRSGVDIGAPAAGDHRVILFWTPWNGKDPLKRHLWQGGGSAVFERCREKRCSLQTNKSLVHSASMLLFYHKDPPNFPPVRHDHQLYVHYTKDPPGLANETYLDAYDDKLNMTMSYRDDADIASPYGYYIPNIDDSTTPTQKPSVPFAKKTKSVVWIVSHCSTQSKRELYVEELSKYIDVDVYGKCGIDTHHKQLGHATIMKQMERMYKFYLAFENNVCPYYYTEKLGKALQVNMVPVVLGMSNYTGNPAVAPPHSVIDVRDFASPKHLAEYLNHLSQNEREYNKYFEWKTKYTRRTNSVMCELCGVVHTAKYQRGERFVPSYRRQGSSYRHWWQGQCDNDLVSRMKHTGGW